MVQKTILEHLNLSRNAVKAIGYTFVICWFILSTVIDFFFIPEWTDTLKFGILFSRAMWGILDLVTIFLVFKIPEIIEKFLQEQKLDTKTIESMMAEVYTLRITKFGHSGKMVNSPLFRNLGRIGMLAFLIGTFTIFGISNYLNNPFASWGAALDSYLSLGGWILFSFFVVDIILVVFYAVFLPREIVQRKMKDPVIYHPDGNFGFISFANFSFKIYLFSFVYCALYIIVFFMTPDPKTPPPSVIQFTFSWDIITYWILVNIFWLIAFFWSLRFYRRLILDAKTIELTRIQSLIDSITTNKDQQDLWKVAGLMDLRDKFAKVNLIPVNASIIRKIAISLFSSVITSILLPNLFMLL